LDAREAEQRFVELMNAWLVSLPFDLKILYEVADDENLDRKDRELAAGAIVYAISPNDAVADRHDSFVSFCDDCILVRMALEAALADGGAEAENIKHRFPEFFGPLREELAVCRAAMGAELYEWLQAKVETLRKIAYKGKTIPDFIDDSDAAALLYDDGLGFTTEYPVEEDTLADRLKRASTVIESLERRRAEEVRGRV
jgi:uncharacterized membrane protein YkvA (DUF1232 family)